MADLTTLANVKDDLGIDQVDLTADDRLGRLITALSAQFEAECGRSFASASYPDTFEGSSNRRAWRPDLGYTLRLVPKQYPVTAVSGLTIDGRTIPQRTTPDVDGWRITDGLYIDVVGLTVLPVTYGYASSWRKSIISATYTAGYSTIPADITQAVTEWVTWKYMRDPRRSGVISTTVAGGGETYTFSQFDKPLTTARVIERYRRRAAP